MPWILPSSLSCVLLFACARAGFDEADPFRSGELTTDASTANRDAIAPPVDPMTRFENVHEVKELFRSNGVDDPSLTADQLEIYAEAAHSTIRATRASRSDPWSNITAVIADFDTPFVLPDGLTIYGTKSASGPRDLWVCRRSSRSAPWGVPELIPELSSADDELSPAVTPDGLVIVFNSRRGGSYQQYLAQRTGTDLPFSEPAPLSELEANDQFDSAWISKDQQTLVYSALQPGTGKDLMVATRPAAGSRFTPRGPLPGLQSAEHETDPWLSPDMRTIYFGRVNVQDSNGRLFTAER